ncbi:NAD(P)-binding domain-containing protein [Streptomyces sp. NBC_01016]|uniref:NAD(P)-dependent oxidoreductase n=1 Tax=Streptomyces sp. NBC_01016 TaxID=2903720 RepID=UPI0022516637|nr:NAD(P)-binding domain-containing protein [Streptomyces sp. NBC_01016]MCX4831283.1 NAD(P)-binding domain-containing protein [Streptomyces sp. NBC_01016]
MTHAGFIGLGSQGAPMARRILDAGLPLTLWARRPQSLEPFAGTKAEVADTPAELAAACDVVGVCVVGDADVEEVVLGESGVLAGLRPGAVLAVHSTVHPDTCRSLGALAAERGAHVVDAPVSGGGPAASEGKLLVMAGGDSDAVERCRPVFAAYGDPVVHLGPLGAGQVTKLLNNTLFTATFGIAASALALGQRLGVEPERFAEVAGHGSAASFALGRLAASGCDPTRMGAVAGGLLGKDVRLMGSLVDDSPTEAAEATEDVLAQARAALERMGAPLTTDKE